MNLLKTTKWHHSVCQNIAPLIASPSKFTVNWLKRIDTTGVRVDKNWSQPVISNSRDNVATHHILPIVPIYRTSNKEYVKRYLAQTVFTPSINWVPPRKYISNQPKIIACKELRIAGTPRTSQQFFCSSLHIISFKF